MALPADLRARLRRPSHRSESQAADTSNGDLDYDSRDSDDLSGRRPTPSSAAETQRIQPSTDGNGNGTGSVDGIASTTPPPTNGDTPPGSPSDAGTSHRHRRKTKRVQDSDRRNKSSRPSADDYEV